MTRCLHRRGRQERRTSLTSAGGFERTGPPRPLATSLYRRERSGEVDGSRVLRSSSLRPRPRRLSEVTTPPGEGTSFERRAGPAARPARHHRGGRRGTFGAAGWSWRGPLPTHWHVQLESSSHTYIPPKSMAQRPGLQTAALPSGHSIEQPRHGDDAQRAAPTEHLDRSDDACRSVVVPDGSFVVEQAASVSRRTTSERIRFFLSQSPAPRLLDSPPLLRAGGGRASSRAKSVRRVPRTLGDTQPAAKQYALVNAWASAGIREVG